MSTVYSPFIAELKEKMEFEGAFLVKICQLHMDKNGRPYLNLILMDKTGEVEARVWDNAAKLAEEVRTQDLVRVAGKVNLYQGRKQIVIEAAAKVPEGSVPLDRFVPASAYDVNRLHADMVALFKTLEDRHLRDLAVLTLEDPDCKKRILRAPAAKSVHHAYAGGLIEHSLSVCRILDSLAKHYRNYYGPAVSRDLLLIGGLFHDIGKIFELSFERGTEYTKEGQLIGHHVLGCELVDRITSRIEGFPADLKIHVKHLILAHHGKLEYGSPKVPHSVEALLVHYVDDLDSKVNTILEFIGDDTQHGEFTAVNRMFEHPFLKPKTPPKFQGSSPGADPSDA
ncbi:MAG: 3'-5' exoribonuclease YhaM family protein [Bdellovibrionota bacterium]